MTSLEILCKRSSCEMAADKNEASLAPAESEVEDEDVDVDDVRRSSILKPEKSRPVRDRSLPCIPYRERERTAFYYIFPYLHYILYKVHRFKENNFSTVM